MKYDGMIDKECIELCDVLNELNGVKTVESCCGHLKDNYRIWLTISNWYSLSILSRVFDKRYSNAEWRLEVVTADITKPKIGATLFMIVSESPFCTYEAMKESLKDILDNIKHWKSKRYEKHLKGEQK